MQLDARADANTRGESYHYMLESIYRDYRKVAKMLLDAGALYKEEQRRLLLGMNLNALSCSMFC
jgi:hypothetical protein